MFWTRFLPREKVTIATTPEEREAVYRFRYAVYVDEKKWTFGGPDHERRQVRDAHDDQPYSRQVYVGDVDDIKGACRLMVWDPGAVPDAEFEEFSMKLFPNIASLRTAEIGRFCIRPGFRGKLVLPSLASAVYDHLVAVEEVDLSFCVCRPTLMRYYARLGSRPYRGELVPYEFGMAIPLVSVLSDEAYFRKVGAITARNVRKHFGRGGREPLDQRPFQHLFAEDQQNIEVDRHRVLAQLDRWMASGRPVPTWLTALPRQALKQLAAASFIMDAGIDVSIVKEGMAERELYLLMDGAADVLVHGSRVNTMGAGDVVGELAFFRDAGVRTATVVTTEPSKVLVLRYKFLEELKKSDPDAAFAILFQLGRVLADRLEQRTSDVVPE